MSRWVQHISGQGQKWEVYEPHNSSKLWAVNLGDARDNCAYLPVFEYVLCDPPEQWEDVTGECHAIEVYPEIPLHFQGGIASSNHDVLFEKSKTHGMSYQLRKVEVNRVGPGIPNGCKKQWSFIVERRRS